MPDLTDQLASYIDTVAPPLTLDEIRARAPRTPAEHDAMDGTGGAPPGREQPATDPGFAPRVAGRRRRRWLAATAAATVLVAGIGWGLGRRAGSTDENDRVYVGPVATAPDVTAAVDATERWRWLETEGLEVPVPTAPDGWLGVDVGSIHVAVPSGWMASTGASSPCARTATDGAPAPGGEPAATPTDRTTSVVISPFGGDCRSDAVVVELGPPPPIDPTTPMTTVGALRAVAPAPEFGCKDCMPTYQFDDGTSLTVRGIEATRILDTVTASGREQLRHQGAAADRNGWQTVEAGGVAIDIPAAWPVSDTTTGRIRAITSDGTAIESTTTTTTQPGCDGLTFTTSPAARIGPQAPPGPTWCPTPIATDPVTGTGVWLETEPGELDAARSTIIARGTVDGMAVRAIDPGLGVDGASLFDIDGPRGRIRLHVQSAHGPAMARAILHSLRPAGRPAPVERDTTTDAVPPSEAVYGRAEVISPLTGPTWNATAPDGSDARFVADPPFTHVAAVALRDDQGRLLGYLTGPTGVRATVEDFERADFDPWTHVRRSNPAGYDQLLRVAIGLEPAATDPP